MKSPKDKERYRQWRLDNPEKVAAQRERAKARKNGNLEPWVKPEPLTAEQLEERKIEWAKRKYQKRKERLATDPDYARKYRAGEQRRAVNRYLKLKADPEALAKKLEQDRIRNRLKKGIPLDAPVMTRGMNDEQRAIRAAEKERLKAERAAAPRPQRPKMSDAERRERRRVIQREYSKRKTEIERAKRAKELRLLGRYSRHQPRQWSVPTLQSFKRCLPRQAKARGHSQVLQVRKWARSLPEPNGCRTHGH